MLSVTVVDWIATVASILSFLTTTILWYLLFRVRRKMDKSGQKRSSILLTTHVYYMAFCDALLSIWCIVTYSTPLINSDEGFLNNDNDDDLNQLTFDTIADNIGCFFMAMLGQFSAIASAAWYMMISYCLWRILFGHNPLSASKKLIKNKVNKDPPNNNKRNIKIVKMKHNDSNIVSDKTSTNISDDKNNKYIILPVKEDETMEYINKNNIKLSSSLSPAIDLIDLSPYSYNNDNKNQNKDVVNILHQKDSSVSSAFSIFSSVSNMSPNTKKDKKDSLETFNQHQKKEQEEISSILRRHHIIVWSASILLTFIPFSTKSMGIDVQYISGQERSFECWIGSKFWVFSFYSIITIAVLNAILLLLFISIRISFQKYKIWLNDYKKRKKQKQRTVITKMYDYRGASLSLYDHNERGSSNATRLSSATDSSKSFYRKRTSATMVLKRFGIFVGCYLLCWIIPCFRRYYALFIDKERDVPDWLILSNEIFICIFPMANAIVWYTNISFRKLINKNLNIQFKCSNNNICCYFCRSNENNNNKSNHNQNQNPNQNKKEKHKSKSNEMSQKLIAPYPIANQLKSKPKSIKSKLSSNSTSKFDVNYSQKSNKSMGGASSKSDGVPTSYGSFCETIDMVHHFSFPNFKQDNNSNKTDVHINHISSTSLPKFKTLRADTLLGNSSSDGSYNFNGSEYDTDNIQSDNSMDYPSHIHSHSGLKKEFDNLKKKQNRKKKKHYNEFEGKASYYGNNGNSNIGHHKGLLSNVSNASVFSDNFVNDLFSDNEDYENTMQKFKNSISEFDEDDQHEEINIYEDHFSPTKSSKQKQ